MKRFVLLLGSMGLALAVACSSKEDSGKAGNEQDICETKPDAKGCPSAPGAKLGGKKDAGSSGPGTPTPTPDPEPTPDAGSPTSDGSTPQSVNPRDVCVDTANAVATAAQRCGELFADAFQDFVNAAAGGDCKNVKNIRDVNALYQQCIPWIQKATCNDLRSGSLPDTCLGQLLP